VVNDEAGQFVQLTRLGDVLGKRKAGNLGGVASAITVCSPLKAGVRGESFKENRKKEKGKKKK